MHESSSDALPGGAEREQVLLFGAHYDRVAGGPGADDNASGVAALLEIAGLFAATSANLTVRLVAFVNEEPPFFMTGASGQPGALVCRSGIKATLR